MTVAKMSFGHFDIFCGCFFKAFASSCVANHLLILALVRCFCIFAQVAPLSAFYLFLSLVVRSLLWHIRDAKDFVPHLLPPALTRTAVCDALGPLLVQLFHLGSWKKWFWIWEWRNWGTKESFNWIFSKERPGWFLVSRIYLFIPSKEIG